VNLSRSVHRYQPDNNRDLPVVATIQAVLEIHPSYGFGKLFKTLRRQGYRWNHKRVYRVYCLLKLNKRRKGKRRLPSRHPQPLVVPPKANRCWSVDIMSDALMCGRRFRTFNIVDDFNREALAIEIDLSLPAPRVIRVLERVSLLRGYPEILRVDIGLFASCFFDVLAPVSLRA
jgi:putative transposase